MRMRKPSNVPIVGLICSTALLADGEVAITLMPRVRQVSASASARLPGVVFVMRAHLGCWSGGGVDGCCSVMLAFVGGYRRCGR